MRNRKIIALFLCAIFIGVNQQQAAAISDDSPLALSAGSLQSIRLAPGELPVAADRGLTVALADAVEEEQADEEPQENPEDAQQEPAAETADEETAESEPAQAEPAEPSPVTHTVAAGDSLSKIAEAHNTTWVRLFYKNTQIENPDQLSAGDVITIPLPEEQLVERALPPPPAPVVAPSTSVSAGPIVRPAHDPNNRYTPGNCTWYSKSRRPDLPNNLGNANTWLRRAAAQGIPTGSVPRVGAIAAKGMHVMYVESVNADGSVTISEMNWTGLYQTSTRTQPASYFDGFIY